MKHIGFKHQRESKQNSDSQFNTDTGTNASKKREDELARFNKLNFVEGFTTSICKSLLL